MFDRTQRADLLPETRAFLTSWLSWVDAGAPDVAPYRRDNGLCDSVWDYTRHASGIRYDLRDAFGTLYPFGSDDYDDRSAENTQHECPQRLAWVRLQLGVPS